MRAKKGVYLGVMILKGENTPPAVVLFVFFGKKSRRRGAFLESSVPTRTRGQFDVYPCIICCCALLAESSLAPIHLRVVSAV